MINEFVLNLGWVAAAAVLGFGISAIFAGRFHLPRNQFLGVYLILVAPFLYAFTRWSGLSVMQMVRHHWGWGLAGAALIGAFLVRNIRSQPASPRTQGLSLAFEIIWLGIVYGALDALFLSVLPVLATWQAFSALGWTAALPAQIAVSLIALCFSLLVTAAYHLGYPEYHAPGGMLGPAIGNGIMSAGYLLTHNPISAVFSHIAMHIAGVLRGPATVIQLPPHYETQSR